MNDACSTTRRSVLGLAFGHLNLRRNPFAEPHLDDRAALAVLDRSDWIDQLRQPGRALQILGGCGRGRTTHIVALARSLPEAAIARCSPGGHLDPPWPTCGARRPILLLDEADHLPRRRLRKALVTSSSMSVATHVDLSRELRSCGLSVDTLNLEATMTVEKILRIATVRIESCRRTAGPIPFLDVDSARALLGRYGSDLRSMLDHLYDSFQRLEAPGAVEV